MRTATVFGLAFVLLLMSSRTRADPHCHGCRAVDPDCMCDEHCGAYGDCCHDAPAVQNARRSPIVACVPFGSPSAHQGAFMIAACPRRYKGPGKCREQNDMSDPLWSTPVTDTRSGVTYRNRGCAECNYAHARALAPWRLSLECDLGSLELNSTLMKQHVRYRADVDSWGVRFHGLFHPCRLQYDRPSTVTVRPCRADLVGTCPGAWRHVSSRRGCEGAPHQDIVYLGTRAYRNRECALCNGAAGGLRCHQDQSRSFSRRAGWMSFAVLLDMNFANGEEVGKVRRRCPFEHVYDPFHFKCRAVTCALPGYKVVGDGCQPK